MDLLPTAGEWLLSPAAIGYVPILVMQGVILGYLLLRRSRSTST